MTEAKTDEQYETPAVVVGQKRQNSDNGGPASKRPNVGDPEVQVKVLIPAGAVGALIGKGGESMRQLKTDSGCRVQMSKNQELFQNTNERICLVKGKVTSCMMVMKTILEKIQEKIEATQAADAFDLKGVTRPNEMKVVVPNTSAGMVIGKSGSSIKEIRESTGANIQVYPKAGSEEAKQSMERVITVGADQNNILMDAIQRVLEKVSQDPMHAQEAQKSEQFPGNQSFGFGGMDTRSQFGNLSSFGGSTNSVWQSQSSIADNGFGNKAAYAPGQIKYNGIPVLNNNEVISFLDNLQNTLRTSGFTEGAVAEIMQAMNVLARYNIMGLGLGLGVATMAQSRTNEANQGHQLMPQGQGITQRYDLTSGLMGGNGGLSILDAGDGRQESLSGHQPGGVLIDVLSQNSGSDSSFAASVIKERLNEEGRLELEVPDAIVGAVLGPKAKTLVEIQQLSGCKVEVHKRGTTNVSNGHRLIRSKEQAAMAYKDAGELDRAVALFEESAQLFLDANSWDTAAQTVERAGRVLEQADEERALALYRRGMKVVEQAADHTKTLLSLSHRLLGLLLKRREFAEAAQLSRDLIQRYKDIEEPAKVGQLGLGLVLVGLAADDPQQARQSLGYLADVGSTSFPAEMQAAQALVVRFEKGDREGFDEALRSGVVRAMDNHYLRLLKDIRLPAPRPEPAEDEEEDLR